MKTKLSLVALCLGMVGLIGWGLQNPPEWNRNRIQQTKQSGLDQNETNSIESNEPMSFGPLGSNVQEEVTPVKRRPKNSQLQEAGDIHFGYAEPTIIDTRNFKKQIYRDQPFTGEQLSTSSFRPRKSDRPTLQPGPANLLVPGSVAGAGLIQPQVFFPGITASPWNPPDPALGVGPNHVIETVNMELAFFSKDGTLEFQQRLDSSGDPGFFEELGSGGFCFDPKCFFDPYSQRYFVLALEVYQSIDEAWITFAISDDDDPHGIWYKYRTWAVVSGGETDYWVDYPGLGFDADGFYVTGNLFRLTGPGGFGGVLFRSFEKTALLNGDPVVFGDVRDPSGASVQVAQSFGEVKNPLFVSVENSTQLLVQSIIDPFNNPTLVSELVDIPGFSGPPSAENPGGFLSIVGSRIMNAHFRDGKLWTCHSIESDDGSTSVARWYEMDMGEWPLDPTPPSFNQSGEIDLGAGEFTFFPAIYSNKFGNIAMVCGNSTANRNPGVIGTGRLYNDPVGTMRTPTEFVLGTSGADGRWGDYFDIAIDPNDDRTFWIVGEYRESSGWRTWIEKFTLEELVPPKYFAVAIGQLFSGNALDLRESDDSRVEILSENGTVQINAEILPSILDPAQLFLTVELRVGSNKGSFDRTVQIYNHDLELWETTDSQSVAKNLEVSETVELTGDLTSYINPNKLSISVRVIVDRTDFEKGQPNFVGAFDLIELTMAE